MSGGDPSVAREAVLGRIRAALADVPPDEDPSTEGIERRYRRHLASGEGALVETFADKLQGYKVTVTRVPRAAAREAIGAILRRRNLRTLVAPADFPDDLEPADLRFRRDSFHRGGTGSDNAGLSREEIAAADGAVTLCAVAIAQTGTIVLDGGPGQGRRALSLLPDYHLCVVDAGQIVGLVPQAVERTADAVRAGRPLTFVSGPSATSDIELNRVEGVHGPRTLDVLILVSGNPA
jgi:L-lactate dehydrogenase complex protein LldG